MKKILLCMILCSLVLSGCGNHENAVMVNEQDNVQVNLNSKENIVEDVVNKVEQTEKNNDVENEAINNTLVSKIKVTEVENGNEYKVEVVPVETVKLETENKVNITDEVGYNSAETKSELTGEFKKFETKDLKGNEIDESIISNAKLTVLNIWGTFCSPCIGEIPHLAELSDEYKDKSVQIVGIVSDAYSDTQIDKANQILEKCKATYLNILPSEDLNEIYLKNVYYIPETLFIDDTGKILDSIVGAMDKDSWKIKIDEMLKKVTD